MYATTEPTAQGVKQAINCAMLLAERHDCTHQLCDRPDIPPPPRDGAEKGRPSFKRVEGSILLKWTWPVAAVQQGNDDFRIESL